MRIMKSEVREMQNDEADDNVAPQQQQAIEQPQPQPQQQYQQQPQQGQYGNPAQNNQ